MFSSKNTVVSFFDRPIIAYRLPISRAYKIPEETNSILAGSPEIQKDILYIEERLPAPGHQYDGHSMPDIPCRALHAGVLHWSPTTAFKMTR